MPKEMFAVEKVKRFVSETPSALACADVLVWSETKSDSCCSPVVLRCDPEKIV